MKKESRILGIDDGPFDKFQDKECIVIGVLYRGGNFLDGVLSTKVGVDGFDSTLKLIEMINNCKWKQSLQAIMLDGIALAGFNVINAPKLNEATGIPVIVVMRNEPDLDRMHQALEKLGMKEKIGLLEKLPKPEKVNDIYVQCIGLELENAKEFLRIACTNSKLPEPIRVAHIIASGLAFGESKGNS